MTPFERARQALIDVCCALRGADDLRVAVDEAYRIAADALGLLWRETTAGMLARERAVECPTCAAAPGEKCHSNGREQGAFVHKARREQAPKPERME